MANARSNSRPMFWRIVRRLIAANRGRLIVILLALGAGAAVTAALLNLQIDAKKRLTTEFRAFGANVVVAPKNTASSPDSTIPESLDEGIPSTNDGNEVTKIDALYVLVQANRISRPPQTKRPNRVSPPTNTIKPPKDSGSFVDEIPSSPSIPVVVVGYGRQKASTHLAFQDSRGRRTWRRLQSREERGESASSSRRRLSRPSKRT